MQVIKTYKTLFDKTKKQYCYLKNDRIEYCEVPVLIPLTKKMHFKFLPPDVRQYAVENCYIKHMELKVKSYAPVKPPVAQNDWYATAVKIFRENPNLTIKELQKQFFPERTVDAIRCYRWRAAKRGDLLIKNGSN